MNDTAGTTIQQTLHSIVKANDIRGLVGSQLSIEVVTALGTAFAHVVAQRGGSRVVIGHDMRESSPTLAAAFADGVTGAGIDVVELGLCSTDAVYYASGAMDLAGVMFTASHNPAGWNGLKLCLAGARPISLRDGLQQLRDEAIALLSTAGTARGDGARGSRSQHDVIPGYGSHLRGLVGLAGIRPLRVVVDAGNGMAGLTCPAVLGTERGLPALPLEIIPLYFELDGTFPNHEANPLDPKNLLDLQTAVITHGADLGLAFDGDADRCFVVDERGLPVSPSAITALIAEREIHRERAAGREATVVHNLITSAAVPEVIAENGGQAVRCPVGHSFVKAEMAAHDAIFGGEHSAHYYFRDFWFADTGMLAALHVLAALGRFDGPLSRLVGDYQRYPASGELNSTVADPHAEIETIAARYADQPGVTLDRMDGLTVTRRWSSGEFCWFNLRASNTEPLLRLNVEASTAQLVTETADTVLSLVSSQPAGTH